jgi:hypothetical protein
MPVIAIFRWKGDPNRLLAGYDREFRDPPPAVLNQPKRTLHACASTDDGLVIVDVWKSEQDLPGDDGRPRLPEEPAQRRLSRPKQRRRLAGSRIRLVTQACGRDRTMNPRLTDRRSQDTHPLTRSTPRRVERRFTGSTADKDEAPRSQHRAQHNIIGKASPAAGHHRRAPSRAAGSNSN